LQHLWQAFVISGRGRKADKVDTSGLRRNAQLIVFLSGRFKDDGTGADEEIAWMRQQLEAQGVIVVPTASPDGIDRMDDIAEGVANCDAFVVFGTANYGENTGNPMCSFNEFNYAKAEGKTMAWINMNGGKMEFNELKGQATIMMGLQGVIYKMWEQNDAMVQWVANMAKKAR
jgi:hypothetical protein